MPRKRNLLIILVLAILYLVVACAPRQPPAPVITEVTTAIVYGVIYCPECIESDPHIELILWGSIDNIAGSGGRVRHGERCQIIDSGFVEGIEKYKLNCSGKVGWLRAEGVKRQ